MPGCRSMIIQSRRSKCWQVWRRSHGMKTCDMWHVVYVPVNFTKVRCSCIIAVSSLFSSVIYKALSLVRSTVVAMTFLYIQNFLLPGPFTWVAVLAKRLEPSSSFLSFKEFGRCGIEQSPGPSGEYFFDLFCDSDRNFCRIACRDLSLYDTEYSLLPVTI